MPVDENLCTTSYARGPDRPLLELTIGDLLHRTADRFGERLAVASCHQSKRLTWAELSAEADRVARGLWALGIRRGDRVGLWSTNCIEWIMMHMGCARAGAALVNVNPAYRSHELQFTLTRSRMKALFLWHKDKHADYEEILGRARHGLELALEHTIYFDSPEWTALLDAEGRLPEHVAVDDVANIQYTSGTTGPAQGRDADPPQRGEQRAVSGPGIPLHRAGQDCCSGAAVPLLRMRDRDHERGEFGRGHRAAQLDLRSAGDAQGGPRRAGDQCLRRSGHVRGGDGAARLCQLRPDQPAHRHDERRAVPGGADEAGARGDALR